MSRRRQAEKREILPDPKFGDMHLTKFINCLMLDGKKEVAERVVYAALDTLGETVKQNPVDAFHEILKKVAPELEVKSRRVGGATYQVPVEVNAHRGRMLSMRWIIAAARKRSERTMAERLAGELNDAYNDRGASLKKRDEVHKMAEANKAFAHFRY